MHRKKKQRARSKAAWVLAAGDRKPTVWLTVGTTVTLSQIPNVADLPRASRIRPAIALLCILLPDLALQLGFAS